MSEGTEPLLRDSHSPPCQSPGCKELSSTESCSFKVPCQAWGMAKGSILRNQAAMTGVPGKPTCPLVPVLPGFSFLLGGGRDQT